MRRDPPAVLLLALAVGCANTVTETSADRPASRAVVQVGAGMTHSCALRYDGTVWCWGDNAEGELGDGTTTARSGPVAVRGLVDAVEIAVGGQHTCARRAGGQVVCWGFDGGFGQSVGGLGDGRTATSGVPVAAVGLVDAVEVAVNYYQSCALRAGGDVWCWGRRGPMWSAVPVRVEGIDDAVEVAVGLGRACVRGRDGEVRCWNGATAAAVAVPGLGPATGIAAGLSHACALRSTGEVWCAGGNGFGQLGDGTTEARDGAVRVVGIDDATAVSSSYWSTCALRRSGRVACWGYNQSGELGDGTMATMRALAADVADLHDVVQTAAGYHHHCALRATGAVVCWGANRGGPLGDGTTTTRTTPVTVLGL